MIQQFVVFFAQMLGLRNKNDPDVILMKLESAYLQFTGMSMNSLHALSADGIVTVFSASGEIDCNRIMITALLFKEEADTLISIKDFHTADSLYKKALKLFEVIEKNESLLSAELREHLSVKEEILKKLAEK